MSNVNKISFRLVFSITNALLITIIVSGCKVKGETDRQERKGFPMWDYLASDITTLKEKFKNPPRPAGPWVYWFWWDNVVSRAEITRELEEMAESGVGGVELRTVSMKGFRNGKPGEMFTPAEWENIGHKRYDYFSPAFIDILEYTLSEAERLDLLFSINLGMGWPPGGSWITDEHRTKHLLATSRVIDGPATFSDTVASKQALRADVLAWKINGEKKVDPASFVDLSPQIDTSGFLQWNVPKGKWLLGEFSTLPGGLSDKGDGPEVDPASREAVLFHLNEMFSRMSPQLDRFYGSTLVDLASDSWEYARSKEGGRYWSPEIIQSSAEILGYELAPKMYALLGYGPDESQVLKDLKTIEEELIHQNYFATVQDFLHERNLMHRPQIYGRGLERDFFEAYSLADIPEVEEGKYVPEAVWVSRLLNKPLTSCEAFTFISIQQDHLNYSAHQGESTPKVKWDELWDNTSVDLLKKLSNAHFARGINRIQIHSFSYSPPEIPHPGWRMYAEIHLNRNASWWNDFPEYCAWAARNQWVLQSGTPVTDFLIYPVEANLPDGPFNVLEGQPKSGMNAIDAADPWLLNQIVKRDQATPEQIRNVVIKGDVATLEEAGNLAELARRGIPVWCAPTGPSEWTVFSGDTENPSTLALQQYLAEAEREGLVKVTNENWQTVVAENSAVRWEPDSGLLSYQHRKLGSSQIYFLSSWEKPFSGKVHFPYHHEVPEIWDAATGEIQAVVFSRRSSEDIAFELAMEPNQSVIVVFP